eukprot:scaffold98434_cov41-Prasinocladus_malaysianus.AAC.1
MHSQLAMLHRLAGNVPMILSGFCACIELENHLGIADKTLAEFIIDLSKGKESVKAFKKELDANGAEMPASFVETLFNIIRRLMV